MGRRGSSPRGRADLALAESSRERSTAAGEDGLAVTDEDAFDRQVEQRPQAVDDLGVGLVADPGARQSSPPCLPSTTSPKTRAQCAGIQKTRSFQAVRATSTPCGNLVDRVRRTARRAPAELRLCDSAVSRTRTGAPARPRRGRAPRRSGPRPRRHERVDQDDRIGCLVVARSRPPAPSRRCHRPPASRPGGGRSSTRGRFRSPVPARRLYPGKGTYLTRKEMHASHSYARLVVAGVAALALVATAGAAPPKLVGTVGPGFTITLKRPGRPSSR